MAVAILENCTETIGVNLEDVVQLHYSRVVQFLLNIIFSNGMSVRKITLLVGS